MLKEIKEWPKIFYHSSIGSSPFDDPKLEHSLKKACTQTEKPIKLCELCMINYTDTTKHIKGLQHKKNATSQEKFGCLDRAIVNAPSITELIVKKMNS